MSAKRRAYSGGGRVSRYDWTGAQLPLTDVPTAGLLLRLNDAVDSEVEGTVQRIRGWLCPVMSGSDAATAAVTFGAKIGYWETNDAQSTLSGDHQGIDVNAEDIRRRQLWTYFTRFPVAVATQAVPLQQIEIDVKVKIRIRKGDKSILGLLMDSSVANRVQVVGYLRVLIKR